ncbi:hypothetical protein [Halomonas ramblicola]|uniref:hypothetical protein n=1 Tax=Halomonas ramblicola TaxID=747349 RepID=UPI0025B5F4CF|nr:hypothetical protein [Halomonas ramblicola]MDN3523279.1 hypothetical protein [Halomonas ramblicola]
MSHDSPRQNQQRNPFAGHSAIWLFDYGLPNRDYPLNLAAALRELGVEDDPVFALAGRLPGEAR